MSKKTVIALHIIAWMIIFSTPLMFTGRDVTFDVRRYIFFSVVPLTLVIVFYLNYFHLIETYFLNDKKKQFVIINTILIIALGFAVHYWMNYCIDLFKPEDFAHSRKAKGSGPILGSWVFSLKDSFNMTLSCVVATTILMAKRLHETENARREAENAKTEAELKNLRAQINPHFLLNTLNNIYALTAFDTPRAQKAIDELSRILRHVLYDNEKGFVSISEEVKFISDYVSLMRIRVAANVDIKFNIHIDEKCQAFVAPMIFISLVENAFKHGISATQDSFIGIDIKADDNKIECHIRNSNFPKPKNDHSGHGIGLTQVGKRLELIYKDKYKWEKWTDNNVYNSKIIIYDTKLRNY